MAQSIIWGTSARRVRIIPATIGGQITQAQMGAPPNNKLAAGENSVDKFYAATLAANPAHPYIIVYDLGYATSVDSSALQKVTDTVCVMYSTRITVAVAASAACELRLYFGGTEKADARTLWTSTPITAGGLAQVVDYPALFIPAGTTQWTVWRGIVAHDRFFLPALFNISGGDVTAFRIHIGFGPST